MTPKKKRRLQLCFNLMAMTNDYHKKLGREYADEDEEEEEEEEEYEDEEDDVEPEEPAAELPQHKSERPLTKEEMETLELKLSKLSDDQIDRFIAFFASDVIEEDDGERHLNPQAMPPSRQRMLVRFVDLELKGHKVPCPGSKAAFMLLS